MKNNEENNIKKIVNNEIKIHPEISICLNKDNNIKYEFLNLSKSNSISTRNIKNVKKNSLIESLNTFKNIYYDFSNIKQKFFNKKKELEKENTLFEKDYNKVFNKNSYDFNELKNEYKKKNYKFPKIKSNENLFDKNVLILNNSDLNKYIIYGSRNLKEDKKSINFLYKIQAQVDSMRVKDNSNHFISKNNSASKLRIKKIFHPFKSIKDYKVDIYKIKKTFNNLSDLDNFFDKNNSSNNTIINSYGTRETSEINSPKINRKPLLRLEFLKKQNKNDLIINNETNENENQNIKKYKQSFPSHLNHNILNKSLGKKTNLFYKYPLEKLYNKVSKVKDPLIFNNSIKSYFKNKKINIENKITNSSLLKQINQSKNQFFEFDLKKNYELFNQEKKIFKLTKEQSEKIEKNNYLNNQINNYEKKIINNISKT